MCRRPRGRVGGAEMTGAIAFEAERAGSVVHCRWYLRGVVVPQDSTRMLKLRTIGL